MLLKDKLVYNQTSERTLAILLYELGRVSQYIVYQQVYKDKPGTLDYMTPKKDIEAELSDSLTMLRLLGEQLGFREIKELLELGEERFLERMKDIQCHGSTKD